MEYKPLPPITPISACANYPPESLVRAQVKLVIIQDENPPSAPRPRGVSATISSMQFCATIFALLLLCRFSEAQDKPADKTATRSEPRSVTVPAAIDHNRIVINADVPLPDGSTHRVHAWVDNGNPDLYLSRRLATLLGLAVSCNDHECSSPSPREMTVGGM